MQRRTSPSILLYGFGVALAVSLAFNGFLLVKQTHRVSLYDYETGTSVNAVDHGLWQRQLSDCQQASQFKDSVIHHLEQVSSSQPGGAVIVQHSASR